MAYDNNQPPKVGINSWRFSGKVVKKNFKFSDKGNAFASVMIRIPSKNEKFSTVMWIKAFKDTAERIEELVREDTNWSFSGYVSNSKYEKNGQTQYSTDFIVTRFTEAVEEDAPQTEAAPESAPRPIESTIAEAEKASTVPAEDDVPF